MDDLIITFKDVLDCGHCITGTKRWFSDHRLEFRDFVKNGIPAKVFIEHGDHLAQDVVDRVMAKKASL